MHLSMILSIFTNTDNSNAAGASVGVGISNNDSNIICPYISSSTGAGADNHAVTQLECIHVLKVGYDS